MIRKAGLLVLALLVLYAVIAGPQHAEKLGIGILVFGAVLYGLYRWLWGGPGFKPGPGSSIGLEARREADRQRARDTARRRFNAESRKPPG